MKGTRSWLLVGLLALVAREAAAIDVVSTAAPAAVTDGALTIGSRSLRLPEGNWTYAAKVEGAFGKGHVDKRLSHYTVYAMDTGGGRMRSAVVLRMPPNSSPAAQWTDQPCKEAGDNALFKDDFGPDYKLPACLVVFKRPGHLQASQTNPLYVQAQQWTTAQGIKSAGPMYEIAYTKFASNDFGMIRVFLPQQAFAGDAEAIAWAKTLPGQVLRLFENRDSQATLAPFPARGR